MNGISDEEVAHRLVRALRLDTVMRDDDRLALRVKVLWPAYEHDRADLNCQEENRVYLRQLEADAVRRRRWDSRDARDDYLVVMGWLVPMRSLTEEQKQQVLAMRKLRRDYRVIARSIGAAPWLVAEYLGLKVTRQSVSEAEFVRRVAWDWDWKSISRFNHSDEAAAQRRWAAIVQTIVHNLNRSQQAHLVPALFKNDKQERVSA